MPRSFYARLHRHFGTTKSGYEQYKEAEQKLAELLERLPVLSYIDRKASSTGKKVAVIGAGFAGLSAAYTLKKAGFDVTVFESQDRIGGRVSSSNVSNSKLSQFKDRLSEKVIEFGAELIGANHLLWLFFARKFGLGINLMTTEEKFDWQGLKEPLYFGDRSILSDTWREIKSQMEKVIDKITQDANQIENPFEPWETPGADILDNISVSDMLDIYVKDLIDEPFQEDILNYLKFEFENNNLTNPSEQSYLGLLSSIKGGGSDDYWEQTELFRCANGNASLAKAFQEKIGDIYNKKDEMEEQKNKILCDGINVNATLTELRLNPDKISLFFKDENKPNDHKVEYTFDYLILAIPTFKLKDIKIKDESLESSHSIKSGDGFKYIIPLKERFWLKSNLSPSGSHQNLGMLWEATDNQSVYKGENEVSNYVLTVFSGGKKATDILKKGDGEIKKLIQELYKDYPEDKDNTINPEPMLVNWVEIAGGGYSCPALGEVTTGACQGEHTGSRRGMKTENKLAYTIG
jgi:monoamine oxidase